jgi:sulfate transport system permease protein
VVETRTAATLPTQAGQTTTRWTLRLVAVGYVAVLVLLPLGVMILRTFEDGIAAFVDSVTSPEALAAIGLSLRVAALAVLINTVFGLTSALLLTRYRFPGRSVLNALIDLPVSVSPVVAGLALILVYGRNGWFGGSLQEAGIQVIYAEPAIVLATCFVSLPLVVLELITLPSVRWALAYGVVLTLARSLGEFGAVRVVAGNVLGSTQTMPLLAAQRYNDLDEQGAYAVSFVMVAVAILCIIVVAILRPKQRT